MFRKSWKSFFEKLAVGSRFFYHYTGKNLKKGEDRKPYFDEASYKRRTCITIVDRLKLQCVKYAL